MKTALEIVEEEFLIRKQRNNNFSKNSLARQLKVSRGELSEILGGQRPISENNVEKIIAYFNLSDPDEFRQLVLKHNLSLKMTRSSETVLCLGEADYGKVTSWLHMSVMALSKMKNFKLDVGFIADALCASRVDVQAVLEDLKNVGVLLETPVGPKFADNYENATDIPSEAARRVNREFIDLAQAHLQSSQHDIFFGSRVLNVKTSDLPMFKNLLSDLLHKICEVLETENATEMYRFSLQFVPNTFRDDV